jgi:RHS repeat-associated protein
LDEAKYLNTPRLVADATGTTVWRWDQAEPFGSNPADEDPDANSVAFDLPLRLPGQRYDQETALHYNYFRDYDPSLGIYKQSDPIGLSGGLNTYVYAADPITQVDPSGLMGSRGGKASADYGPCSYYDDVAATVGCKYHGFAGGVCRGEHAGVNFMSTICMITTAQLNCIRRCLVDEDRSARGSKSCRVCTEKGNCTRLSCIHDYHKKCFTKCNVSSFCYGGRYWDGFPNDGDSPNEEKCCGR